jgi:hypothetical protein
VDSRREKDLDNLSRVSESADSYFSLVSSLLTQHFAPLKKESHTGPQQRLEVTHKYLGD